MNLNNQVSYTKFSSQAKARATTTSPNELKAAAVRKGSGHENVEDCLPYSSGLTAVCEAHFLKPDGDRGESLALRKDSATQVKKAKRDIKLRKPSPTQWSFQRLPCLASPEASREEVQTLQSHHLISLQDLSLSLCSMWLPCSNYYGSQDAMSATLQSKILI